ncbi:hypothetical protein C8R43DRAFT_920849, partial [Mycena crocata]
MVARYPEARSYLQELYAVRDRWAWAWISQVFTAGIRTNGRVETENRVTKALSGAKKTLFQVFTALNERTRQQSGTDLIRTRESSRKQHPGETESLFTQIIAHLSEHVGPFALNTVFKQMELSVFYNRDVLQLPEGTRTWRAMNNFSNDNAYIETQWLLRLIQNRGLVPVHLVKVTHMKTGATHVIAILPDGRYVCDCCMGLNLGLPCRHYFAVWRQMPGLPFHVSLIRA